MQRDGGHVDLRNVIDADRGGRGDGCNVGREIREAAAVKHVVGGKRSNPARRAIDPDLAANLERVPFDSGLELLIAIVSKPDRMPREEQGRERDVKGKRRMVAPTETAADIGELRVDVSRLDGSAGLAQHQGDGPS